MLDIEAQVKSIIAGVLEFNIEAITSQARLVEDFGADSLHKVELAMALEKAFDIEISEEAAKSLISVQDTVDYIYQQICSSDEVGGLLRKSLCSPAPMG